MKIIYKTGDLLTGPEKYIAHGCNAQGVMRSGIAAQIRDILPQAYNFYRQEYEQFGFLQLGAVQWVNCGNKTVINVISQEFYGRDPNRRYVDYAAVRKAVRNINTHPAFAPRDDSAEPVKAVGFPLIGAGLANGSWAVISSIIEEEATNFQPIVYLYDGKMPKS